MFWAKSSVVRTSPVSLSISKCPRPSFSKPTERDTRCWYSTTHQQVLKCVLQLSTNPKKKHDVHNIITEHNNKNVHHLMRRWLFHFLLRLNLWRTCLSPRIPLVDRPVSAIKWRTVWVILDITLYFKNATNFEDMLQVNQHNAIWHKVLLQGAA